MANLAAEADRLDAASMTPELMAWVYRMEDMVTRILGADSWDPALQQLHFPERSR